MCVTNESLWLLNIVSILFASPFSLVESSGLCARGRERELLDLSLDTRDTPEQLQSLCMRVQNSAGLLI